MTIANNANVPQGIPLANPVYLVDNTGTPISSTNGLPGSAFVDTSISGTVTNNNDAVTIALPGGQATALIQITGTFVGTLNFEASPDSGTTYYAIQASIVGGPTIATTATTTGAWRCNISGFTNFRVRFSPASSGTASIVIRLSAGVHNVFVNNALTASTATLTNVASAASDTALLASNSNRKGAYFYNDSTAVLYLSYGSATAGTTAYTTQIPSQGLFEMPTSPLFTGAVRGIWASANGAVRITELT